MRQFAVRDLYRIPVVVPLVGHEKPGLLQARDASSKRSSEIVQVKVRVRIRKLGAKGITDSLLVLQRQRSESRVLVIVKDRPVELVRAALRGHANTGNARIFCTEIIG